MKSNCLMAIGIPPGMMKKFWNYIEVMTAPLSLYFTTHKIRVNFMRSDKRYSKLRHFRSLHALTTNTMIKEPFATKKSTQYKSNAVEKHHCFDHYNPFKCPIIT